MSKAVATPPTAIDIPASRERPDLFSGAAVNLRPLALAYRIVALVVILTGVVRNADLLTGDPSWTSFLYFTMVSDLICLVWMLLLVLRTARDLRSSGPRGTSTPSARWGGAVMMAITVTMLIYVVVLVPTRIDAGDTDIYSLTDTLIHIVTPALLIADWLLFVPKGAFRWVDPLLWTLIPFAYLAWSVVYGALGGEFVGGDRYPYPFLDVDSLGIGGVLTWIAALTVALVAVGFVYVVVDRVLGVLARRAR
ncbi:Pr6Pr family membrane protein [Microbacterium sp. GCS4]|uniref:Pr6Pr family membrane protein n=1 Tax=Microbacterium sp. GCS4 TaxID=1692239 RepID=UPI00068339C3|nr:Pr6Pr family membrane protein [Microbacterium sp. GCS4]